MSRMLLSCALSCSGMGLALSVVTAGSAETAIEQPLPFDHALHAKYELECVDCHEGVEEYAIARIPRLSLCMECHEEDLEKSESPTPAKARLLSFARAENEIPWVRLYRLPAHVVFSHERHVTLGELECTECHGNHGASERPPPAPNGVVLTMAGCIACHEAHGASKDCVACHR